MSLRRVQSIGEDPTFCLSDRHVHLILGHILDYWADYWDMPRIELPDPRLDHVELPSSVRLRVWKSRFFQLHCAREKPIGSTRFTPPIPDFLDRLAHDEAIFWRAVVQSAVTDFCDGLLGPSAPQYRSALSGYMYIMGIPWFLPKGWSCFDLRGSRDRLSEDADIWAIFPEQMEYLVTLRDPEHVLVPEGAETIDYLQYRSWSFASFCDAFRLDVTELRKQIHLILPSRPKTRRT